MGGHLGMRHKGPGCVLMESLSCLAKEGAAAVNRAADERRPEGRATSAGRSLSSPVGAQRQEREGENRYTEAAERLVGGRREKG